MSNAQKGKPSSLTIEGRAKIAESSRSRIWKKESLQKLSDAKAGKSLSDAHKEKLRLANLGKKATDKTKAKHKGRNLGVKRSEETRLKMSLNRKAAWAKKKEQAENIIETNT